MPSAKPKKPNLKKLPRWDLTHFYPSMDSNELKKDTDLFAKRCADFQKMYEGKIKSLNAGKLATAIKKYEAIEELGGKIGSYSQLLYCENVSDPKRAKFYQDIGELITNNGSYLLFFTLQLNAISEKALKEMMQQSKALAKYEPWLRDIRQMRPYQLPQAQAENSA
jgi:Oligoendopeptidase F